MWVKFRIISHGENKEWRYREYPDDFYDFDDMDDLGNQFWSDYYSYNTQGNLEFERIEKPPCEEILKMIEQQKQQIANIREDIEKLKILAFMTNPDDSLDEVEGNWILLKSPYESGKHKWEAMVFDDESSLLNYKLFSADLTKEHYWLSANELAKILREESKFLRWAVL